MIGVGGTNNEGLDWDFDTTANIVAVSSSTAAAIRFALDLGHTGTNLGFYSATPTPQSAAYTPTNVSADRAYDANATTIAELADVLGTLIADLQLTGIIG